MAGPTTEYDTSLTGKDTRAGPMQGPSTVSAGFVAGGDRREQSNSLDSRVGNLDGKIMRECGACTVSHHDRFTATGRDVPRPKVPVVRR